MEKQFMLNNMKYKRASIALFLTLIILISIAVLWRFWPTLVLFSLKWQREVYGQFSALLHQAKENSTMAGLFLMKLSFWYGLLHAAGPGHGKLIVATYLATHPSKVKVSLILTLFSALLQAIVAISLVSILLLILGTSMREVSSYASQFVTFSFFLIMLLGGMLIWRSGKAWFRRPVLLQTNVISYQRSDKQAKNHLFINKANTEQAENIGQLNSNECSCGHEHFINAELINHASSFKEYAALIFSIGMRPCSGAIMVLLFASMIDIYWLGVLSALVMALGTALTTSLIALVTLFGKRIITKIFVVSEHRNQRSIMAVLIVQALGGTLLFLLGLLLISSQPSGVSPIAF